MDLESLRFENDVHKMEKCFELFLLFKLLIIHNPTKLFSKYFHDLFFVNLFLKSVHGNEFVLTMNL